VSLATQISSLATRIATEFKSVRAAIAGVSLVPVVAKTAAYTLGLTDAGSAVEVTSSSAVNVTVPSNASVAFPVGTVIEVAQLGTGMVTIVAASGVTLNSAGSLVATRAQYSAVSLRKRATNTWLLAGDLA
jgi:hypothetical protein